MRVSATTLAAFLLVSVQTAESFSIQRPSSAITNNNSGSSVRLPIGGLSVASTLETTNAITAGPDGVYSLTNEQEHAEFLSQHPDELVILKVYAPWCRACKGLSPKFTALARDDILKDTPIRFAQLSIQHNKDFIKRLGVLALPTVQFYVAGRLVDTFACGPSKVPLLKRKLSTLISDYVDANGQLKPSAYEEQDDEDDDASVASTEEHNMFSDAEKIHIADKISYFTNMSLADRDAAMDDARVLTFPAGAVIVREGTPGDTFYVIQEGEVELVQQTSKDPLSGYLGTVINQLGKDNFFGERALITGEMNAASVRAATDVRVLAFATDSFPASNVLSGRTRGSYNLDPLNDKYGVVTNMEQTMVKQFRDLSLANQVRGSVNTPRTLEDDDAKVADETLPHFNTDDIFSLVTRMQRIRHVSNCFQYIMDTGATWPSPRRQLLVDRLSPEQRSEFAEIFDLMDVNHDGRIDLVELQRLMQSIGEDDISMKKAEMSFDDYMGLMAEAEFYTLFREIFQRLDHNQSGFVKAQDLEKVLCGVRDLISDDRNSVIDVEDTDMLIDYEQFTRMLLGTALVSTASSSKSPA